MKKLKRLIYLKLARRLSRNNQSIPVPSIISDNTQLNGNIISSGIIHVDGKLNGDIDCEELIIGIRGVVKGHVNAEKMHIYGVLEGTANVEGLFIAKSAKLIGDTCHVTIAIEPGAFIDGRCIRQTADSRAALAKRQADALLEDFSSVSKDAIGS